MVDNDSTIGSILYAIDMMIRQVNWEIQPASESNEDLQLAEFVKGALFEDMSHTWADTLSEILSYLPWGFSYLEIVYKTRDGDTDDPTKRSQFTDGKIGWRKFAIRAQETLSRWQFDEDGGIQGMWQRDPTGAGGEVFIPIDKSLHFKTVSRKNNPEAKSILRNAYTSWYYKTKIATIEAIGIERDLAGLPVAWVPPEYLSTDASPAYQAILVAIKTIVTNVRRDEQEGVVFPLQFDENGNKLFDFNLMSTAGTRQFDTNGVINRYDQRIAASVLADFVMLGSQQNTGAGKALAADKMDLFATALTGFANQISEVINRHGIARLCKLNGFKATKLPELKAGKIESVDLTVLGEYVKSLSVSGFPLFPTADGKLETHLLEVAGLPSPAPEAFVEQAAEQKAEQEAAAAALAKAQAANPVKLSADKANPVNDDNQGATQ